MKWFGLNSLTWFGQVGGSDQFASCQKYHIIFVGSFELGAHILKASDVARLAFFAKKK